MLDRYVEEERPMRLSARQAQSLLVVLQDTLKGHYIAGQFSYDADSRLKLLNDILNQQDAVLRDLNEPLEPSDPLPDSQPDQ